MKLFQNYKSKKTLRSEVDELDKKCAWLIRVNENMVSCILQAPQFPAKVERLRVVRIFDRFEKDIIPVKDRNIIVARALYPYVAECTKITSTKRNDGSIEVTAELDVLKL